MTTITRKQREIIDREKLILKTARQIFRTHGYLGLNMNRIAEELEYAKGTIYQHFKNKEEIILAMAVGTLKKRTSMFEQAAQFKGKSRFRVAAIGCAAELFVKWYPDHFELEKVLSCGSIIEKTGSKLQEKKATAELKCVSIVGGVVRDGVAAGDIKLPPGVTADQLVFGLWSMSFGGYSVMSCADNLEMMGIEDGFQMVRDSNNRLLDGYGWKPLSTKSTMTKYTILFNKRYLAMDPTTTDRSFFSRKMTLSQSLTWRAAIVLGLPTLVICGWIFLRPLLLSQSQNNDETITAKSQSVFVETIKLQDQAQYEIPIWYTGDVVARRKTLLGFQRAGKVTGVTVDQGDRVTRNQVVASLDHRQLSARIKQLGATLEEAQAQFNELQKGPRQEAIRSAAANVEDLDQQLENALLDLARAKNLLPKKAISQQEFDQTQFRAKTLKSRIDSANAKLDELKSGTRSEQIDAAAARVASAQAANEVAEHDLDDCTLRAPFAGTITLRTWMKARSLELESPLSNWWKATILKSM